MFLTLTNQLSRLATAANMLLTLFVALSAVMRYAVGAPFHFTEELVGLLFLIGVALALPQASARDEHIKVGLITDSLRGPVRALVQVFAQLITLTFVGWLLWLAIDASLEAQSRGLVSEQAGFPTWIAYAVIALAAAFMCFASARQLLTRSAARSQDPVPPSLR